jgi:hypothetical protein
MWSYPAVLWLPTAVVHLAPVPIHITIGGNWLRVAICSGHSGYSVRPPGLGGLVSVYGSALPGHITLVSRQGLEARQR